MIQQIRFMSACVEFENTPDSDAQPRVWHVVSGTNSDGRLVRLKVYAKDPMDAIDVARYRKPEDWTLINN